MAIRLTETRREEIRKRIRGFRQLAERAHFLYQYSMSKTWGGSIDDIVEEFSQLNTEAESLNTTALNIIQDHSAVHTFIQSIADDLIVSSPKVTLDSAMFDSAGMVDLTALRTALENLEDE